MTPEVEHLLARCGLSSQVEECVNDILSRAPSELTNRLMAALREVQGSSVLFPRLERGRWYVVAPATLADPPRCLLGEVFINGVVTFPDLEHPPASCSKKEREEFDKLYANTFLEKLQQIQNYATALARAHELSEAGNEMLAHAKDFLVLSIYHAERNHDTSGSADRRDELAPHIEKMKSCLSALRAEQKRRHEEKGSQ